MNPPKIRLSRLLSTCDEGKREKRKMIATGYKKGETPMEEEVVAVVAFDTAGFIAMVTSCDLCDSQRYAKYYRRYYKKVKVMTYEELKEQSEIERRLRNAYLA